MTILSKHTIYCRATSKKHCKWTSMNKNTWNNNNDTCKYSTPKNLILKKHRKQNPVTQEQKSIHLSKPNNGKKNYGGTQPSTAMREASAAAAPEESLLVLVSCVEGVLAGSAEYCWCWFCWFWIWAVEGDSAMPPELPRSRISGGGGRGEWVIYDRTI